MSRLDDAFRRFLIPESIWDADLLETLNERAQHMASHNENVWIEEEARQVLAGMNDVTDWEAWLAMETTA